MQIIAIALLLGLAIFLGIVLYLVLVQNQGHGNAPPRDVPINSLMAVVMLIVTAPLAFIIPRLLTRLALRRIAAGTWRISEGVPPTVYARDGDKFKLMIVRQTTLIVGLALLEGSAFFGCTAYLLEAQPLALGVVGVAVVLMLCKFPTYVRVRAWLDRQADALSELRQQQDSAAGLN
jgi:MFS family permease